MQHRQNHHHPRLSWYLASGVGLTFVLLAPFSVSAQASTNAIAQPYQTKSSSISVGTLVSTLPASAGTVVPAASSTTSGLVGIAVSKPALELSATGASTTTVQVAVGGSSEAFVSDANGTVNAGDKITVSPLAGIGMKALDPGEIVGTAQTALNSVRTISQQFKGTNGKEVTVRVGLIPVAVNVSYYSAVSSGGSVSAFVPPFLQTLANDIAGKAVSPLRVLIGTAALLLGFLAVIVMLYVGVRSGIISLGRNPLAASALKQGMVDVLIGAVGVLVVTGVIVGAVVLT